MALFVFSESYCLKCEAVVGWCRHEWLYLFSLRVIA